VERHETKVEIPSAYHHIGAYLFLGSDELIDFFRRMLEIGIDTYRIREACVLCSNNSGLNRGSLSPIRAVLDFPDTVMRVYKIFRIVRRAVIHYNHRQLGILSP